MTIREYRRGFKLIRRYAILHKMEILMLDLKIRNTKVMTSGDYTNSTLVCHHNFFLITTWLYKPASSSKHNICIHP